MAAKPPKELSEKDRQALRQKAEERLYDAFLCLKTPDECSRFLRDICTPKEIADLTDRWWVARLLDEKKLSYREIRAQTGVSLTTISRVFRFLRQEAFHGYQVVLDRLRKRGE